MTSFPLSTALKHGACPHCSTTRRVVFHHKPALKPSSCRGALLEHPRHLALRALPWLRSAIGRS